MAHTLRYSLEEGLLVCMLDSDAFCNVIEHIDGGARLAVWLTCKAFNASRPPGKFTTSVRAMCATPTMLDWAIRTGLQPNHLSRPSAHMVLYAICEFGTTALAQSGITLALMFTTSTVM